MDTRNKFEKRIEDWKNPNSVQFERDLIYVALAIILALFFLGIVDKYFKISFIFVYFNLIIISLLFGTSGLFTTIRQSKHQTEYRWRGHKLTDGEVEILGYFMMFAGYLMVIGFTVKMMALLFL